MTVGVTAAPTVIELKGITERQLLARHHCASIDQKVEMSPPSQSRKAPGPASLEHEAKHQLSV